jgi:hypothetical protein
VSVFDEGLEIFGDFGEYLGESLVADDAQGQGTGQQAAQVIESQGSVDAILRFDRNMFPGCQKSGQGVEVVADDLGADVLLRSEPSQTGSVLEIEAMLDPFVSLLDPPATVIQGGEGAGGIRRAIEQGRHQDADSAAWRDIANEANLGRRARARVIGGIAAMGGRQSHDRLGLTRAHEVGRRLERRTRLTAHAEVDAAREQYRDQPGGRIAAVEHQEIVRAETIELFEQDLSLVADRIERHALEQLHVGHEKRQCKQLPDRSAAVLIKQGQADLRAVGRQNAQAAPARDTDGLVDQPQEFGIDGVEGRGEEMRASFREGCRGHHTNELGSLLEEREEGVEFSLHGAAHAGEQEYDQLRKGENAIAGEETGLATRGFQKGRRVDKGCEAFKYNSIFRPSYIILYKQCTRSNVRIY